ncbi:MAG: phage antirepressor N-terminal domain-containing protein [Giesbergeria sp.]|nr:phage antirepressor N-terminal domain-containing protein [Giesbergeria sp.]
MKTELIQFHGHDVVTVARDDGQIYVALKPIVEAIGLDWVSQHKRVQRDLVLSSTMVIMTMVAEDGKLREMLCLPLDMLNGWLFGIDASRVKPELKDAVLDYQRECYRVLDAHFRGKALVQCEIYWFARRPRWEFIRRLALEGWPYRAIAKLFDPRMSPGSIANSVQAMVVRGLINPQALATAQHGVSRKAAQRRVPSWGIQQQLCLAL